MAASWDATSAAFVTAILAATLWTVLRFFQRRRAASQNRDAAKMVKRRAHWESVFNDRIRPARERADAWRLFQHGERQWSSSLTADMRALIPGGDIADMNFDGEVFFCLIGLKPCVLIAMYGGSLDKPVATPVVNSLIENVAQPALGRLEGIGLRRIGHRLITSAGINWADAWVLWDMRGPKAKIVEATFFNEAKTSISDAEMAAALDYPGTYMGNLHVTYVTTINSKESIMFEYFASDSEMDAMQRHFSQYKRASAPYFELTLKVESQS